MSESTAEQSGDSPHPSVRRLAWLSRRLNVTNYLEIGVANGQTFFSVPAPYKIAVDPKFRFDWRQQQTEVMNFFEMTSDEWFLKHSAERSFDLIFLDGLHTFEQTLRDFLNSIALSHANTVWVIDDTVPSDVFSAWRDQREAVELRRQTFTQWTSRPAFKGSGRWHGDVFKVVHFIHDFLPMMSYCTVEGVKAQTLIWRRQRNSFKPRLNDLEAISRLSYFDFKKNLDVMCFTSEDEGLEKAALRAQAP